MELIALFSFAFKTLMTLVALGALVGTFSFKFLTLITSIVLRLFTAIDSCVGQQII